MIRLLTSKYVSFCKSVRSSEYIRPKYKSASCVVLLYESAQVWHAPMCNPWPVCVVWSFYIKIRIDVKIHWLKSPYSVANVVQVVCSLSFCIILWVMSKTEGDAKLDKIGGGGILRMGT